jgi:hypothetical protein
MFLKPFRRIKIIRPASSCISSLPLKSSENLITIAYFLTTITGHVHPTESELIPLIMFGEQYTIWNCNYNIFFFLLYHLPQVQVSAVGFPLITVFGLIICSTIHKITILRISLINFLDGRQNLIIILIIVVIIIIIAQVNSANASEPSNTV